MKKKSIQSSIQAHELTNSSMPSVLDNSPVIEKSSTKKQLVFSFTLLTFLVLATIFAILYARGYRLLVSKGSPTVSKTGILNVTSAPNSAQVYIDGHLTGTTASTINLPPNKYTVKVTKDGYYDWQKDVQIQTEVVTSIDALLFPNSPTLQSISTFGVEQALVDPSGSKLAFKIASQSARKNGIYVFNMTSRNLPILAGQSSSTQIVDDTVDNFSGSLLTWSPDGTQLLASISATIDNSNPDQALSPSVLRSSTGSSTYYLLKTDSFNDTPQDVTATISDLFDTWKNQRLDKEQALIKSLKPKVQQFSRDNFHILSWSPDETKILYQASQSAQMPIFITPRRIGNNLLYERRDLKKGAIYVYDITEDINTRIVDTIDQICTETDSSCISSANPPLQLNPFTWFPDSGHLVYVNNHKIQIIEDDGSNMTTIYAGPFIGNYVYPWPDGSKIVILTNLNNPSVSPTLYTIGLK